MLSPLGKMYVVIMVVFVMVKPPDWLTVVMLYTSIYPVLDDPLEPLSSPEETDEVCTAPTISVLLAHTSDQVL